MPSLQTEIKVEELGQRSAEDLLRFAFERFSGRAAIGTSLQKTGVVLIDLAARLGVPFRVFFVDTLLNHPETYELLGRVEERYGITIERYAPEPGEVEALYREAGQYAHFFDRRRCCAVRKRRPLQRALATLNAWISGLRADQSAHRQQTAAKAGWAQDETGRSLLKLNPLREWTARDVDTYTRTRELPYNALYDYRSPYGERYHVIGCRCCHVPVQPDRAGRAGKFPWETGKKECGLHDQGSGI